ncbi:MAG TPA: hypothetical protein VMB50_01885 [Myxococcales bacterium]|nr:hypothetical protein [Myxococcales bacterium]
MSFRALALGFVFALPAALGCGRPACATAGCPAGQACRTSGCVTICDGGPSCPGGLTCVADDESCGGCAGPGSCNCPALPSFICR